MDPNNPNQQAAQPGAQPGFAPQPGQQFAPNPGAQPAPGQFAGQPVQSVPPGQFPQPQPGQQAGQQPGQPPQPQPGQPGQQGQIAQPKANPNSTQNTLLVSEIRDGVVIMNDGSYRAVIMTKSINFDLMSPEEREGIEFGYQSFLNSLYFPIQIFVRSQKVDMRPYLENLNKLRNEQENMLLALLMEDYMDFVNLLANETNIMDKKFYVVIPFYPTLDAQAAVQKGKSLFSGVFGNNAKTVTINENDLETAKNELRNRVQSTLNGLLQVGLQAIPLDTSELIELFYDAYNPDTATRQQLSDFDGMTSAVVTRATGENPRGRGDING